MSYRRTEKKNSDENNTVRRQRGQQKESETFARDSVARRLLVVERKTFFAVESGSVASAHALVRPGRVAAQTVDGVTVARALSHHFQTAHRVVLLRVYNHNDLRLHVRVRYSTAAVDKPVRSTSLYHCRQCCIILNPRSDRRGLHRRLLYGARPQPNIAKTVPVKCECGLNTNT